MDHADTNWISFEVLTDTPAASPPAFWTISGRLASSHPGPISAFVFAPQQDGDFHRVEIGAGETGAEPRSFLFSGLVDLTSFDDIRQDGRLRLILFLPTGANARMVLSHLDLFISERPDEKEN